MTSHCWVPPGKADLVRAGGCARKPGHASRVKALLRPRALPCVRLSGGRKAADKSALGGPGLPSGKSGLGYLDSVRYDSAPEAEFQQGGPWSWGGGAEGRANL